MSTETDTDTVTLPGLALRVALVDGTEHVVRVINPDRIRFDLTRQREGWPKFSEAPFIGMTFLAWAALTRVAGRDVAGTWEQFAHERCADVADDTAKDGGDDVRPTPPAREAGS